jgi:hypothetical protein
MLGPPARREWFPEVAFQKADGPELDFAVILKGFGMC